MLLKMGQSIVGSVTLVKILQLHKRASNRRIGENLP